MLKVFGFAALAVGVAVLVVVKALDALRRKERYRFGFLDGGLLFMGKEVDPRWMLVAVAVYLSGIGALVAWPLGLYERLANRTSECRDLVTDEELQRFAPGFEPLDVHHLDTSCRASSWGPGLRGRFEVEIAAGAWRLREDGPGRLPGAQRMENGVIQVNQGPVVHLYFTAEGGEVHVTLSAEHFDEEDIGTIAGWLPERSPPLLAPFQAAMKARSARPSFLRRHAFWFLLGGALLVVVAGAVTGRVLRARAIRRALDE